MYFYRPAHAICARITYLLKRLLMTYQAELEDCILGLAFTLPIRAAMTLTRLRGSAGSSEPLLLVDAISTKIRCVGSWHVRTLMPTQLKYSYIIGRCRDNTITLLHAQADNSTRVDLDIRLVWTEYWLSARRRECAMMTVIRQC